MTRAAIRPGFVVVHGNRAESLRDTLVQWVRDHPLDPLETETVLVQSNGIAQWLKQSLAADPASGGCGIAAALDCVLPGRFLWRAYRAVLGEGVPETSPFDRTRLVWRLMRLLPAAVAAEPYGPLRAFLQDPLDPRRLHQLSVSLADLFDQYQVYRADWLNHWAGGADDFPVPAAGARALPPDQTWQPDLWRRLLADVHGASGAGVSDGAGVRPAVHAEFLRGVDRGFPHSDLPRRVLVFGISSLPAQSVEALAALARHAQVLLFVLNPCQHFWADIVPDHTLLKPRPSRHPRRDGYPSSMADTALAQHAHPLLAAWGRQGRDYVALLDEYDGQAARTPGASALVAAGLRVDCFGEPGEGSVLACLQDDILHLRPLPELKELARCLDPTRDRSLRFQMAHGPQREVEVLHDQLLAAFAEDPTLQPRDIIVMVPDAEAYAPHVVAVFGLHARDDRRRIPYSVTDRGLRRVDTLLQAVEALLGLALSRIGLSEVLDLLAVPAVQRRFHIDAADIPRLERWLRSAGVRWGLDEPHLARLGLRSDSPGATRDLQAPHTWLAGLRRMLLGYAVGPHAGPWHDVDPAGEVGGLEAALVGRAAVLVESLARWRDDLLEPATPADWCTRLRALLQAFFEPDSPAEHLTLGRLDGALDDWEQACREAKLESELPLSVVSAHWLECVEAGGLGQSFMAGAVTFATLMPMRAIPFRRVYLLGMNDGDFPRMRPAAGFDLMATDYRPGDRARREDDRYLFLEALLSARDHLSISWVGRSLRDNSRNPPSVLVGQLRDHIAAVWRLAGAPAGEDERARADRVLAALTLEHPMQPFSLSYFTGPAGGPATYACEWARGGSEPRCAPRPLPPLTAAATLDLDRLGAFLADPVRTFFHDRLEAHLDRREAEADDLEVFALDTLDRWQLRHELLAGVHLDAVARRAHVEAHLASYRRRGLVPAGAFGEAAVAALRQQVDTVFTAFDTQRQKAPEAEPARFPLRLDHVVACRPLCLADTLDGLWTDGSQGGRVAIEVEPSKVRDGSRYSAGRLARHWVRHLGRQVAVGPVTTVVLSHAGEATLPPICKREAEAHLRRLLEVWHEGLSQPLPLSTPCSFAWLGSRNGSGRDEDKARTAYEGSRGSDKSPGERERSASLRRAFPTWESLRRHDCFERLAQELLGPLHQVLYPPAEGQP